VGETIENCEIASFALCLDPVVQVLAENFFDKSGPRTLPPSKVIDPRNHLG
jgi:hypothetical protein